MAVLLAIVFDGPDRLGATGIVVGQAVLSSSDQHVLPMACPR